MKRALSEMNSSHETRKNLAEINTHGNGINREHKLNTDTMMNLTIIKNPFHYYSKKCLHRSNFGIEASKI